MATIGAFHAYFIDLSTTSFGQGKYLLCFADSSFADCWWRLVSEDDSLKEYELCRIKPQYYVGSLKNNDGINKCLYLGVENRNDDHNTVSKAMFVRDIAKWDSYGNHNYNQPECIPAQEAPEYRSGSWYVLKPKLMLSRYLSSLGALVGLDVLYL
ncbi:hypothetical protein BDZ91DRAFT_242922 [Kalaharituber pfeilii]|nr:hypothetical protein BDZ91DRAFT_242922 [Kalaharituber pfeilii]